MKIYEIEEMLPIRCVMDICNPGDNTFEVEAWQALLELKTEKDHLVDTLSDYWDCPISELEAETHIELEQRAIWIAARNLYDSMTDSAMEAF